MKLEVWGAINSTLRGGLQGTELEIFSHCTDGKIEAREEVQ